MKYSKVFLLLVLLGGFQSAYSLNSDRENNILRDAAGNIVTDSNGQIHFYGPSKTGSSKSKNVIQNSVKQNTAGSTPVQSIINSSGAKIFKKSWAHSDFGNGIGKSGFIAANIDNDAAIEIIVGASTFTFGLNNYWYVVEFDVASNAYRIVWNSPVYSSNIVSIVYQDDGLSKKIFIATQSGEVDVYDATTLQQIDQFTGTANLNRMILADADNDGNYELVTITSSKIQLFDPVTYQFKSEINYGGTDIAVGNVDGDSANEIVIAEGYVLEYDGTTTTLMWDYTVLGFGTKVRLANIDNDSYMEIIGASGWYLITAFDADITTPKWQASTSNNIDAVTIANVDADPEVEILYGDAQHGSLHVLDAATGIEDFSISNSSSGISGIAVVDSDADGVLEILWGNGSYTTGSDYFNVYAADTQLLEFSSIDTDGPFKAIDIGDVDGDGSDEIVIISDGSNSGYDDGVMFIYDANTLALEWQSSTRLFNDNAWTGIHDVAIGDVDNNGTKEIVVATDDLYDGTIYVLDGTTRAIIATYTLEDGSPIYALAIADVDNDGENEIIAGGGMEHTGSTGTKIYVLDGATGNLEWQSVSLATWTDTYGLEVADIDGDGVKEIVALPL